MIYTKVEPKCHETGIWPFHGRLIGTSKGNKGRHAQSGLLLVVAIAVAGCALPSPTDSPTVQATAASATPSVVESHQATPSETLTPLSELRMLVENGDSVEYRITLVDGIEDPSARFRSWIVAPTSTGAIRVDTLGNPDVWVGLECDVMAQLPVGASPVKLEISGGEVNVQVEEVPGTAPLLPTVDACPHEGP